MSKIKREIEERQSYSLNRRSRDSNLRISKTGHKRLKSGAQAYNIKISTTDSIAGMEQSSFIEYNSPIITQKRFNQGNTTFINSGVLNHSFTNLQQSASNRSVTKGKPNSLIIEFRQRLKPYLKQSLGKKEFDE